LLVQAGDGTGATCERMSLKVDGAALVLVSVEGKQVQLRAGADCRDGGDRDCFGASADRVTRGGPGGATLTLEGKAKLRWTRKGKSTEAAAGGVAVNRLSGHVEAEVGAPPAIAPPPPEPTPVSPCSPATLRPVPPGPSCGNPPADAEVLRALRPADRGIPHVYEESRDNYQIVTERLLDRADVPRLFPL